MSDVNVPVIVPQSRMLNVLPAVGVKPATSDTLRMPASDALPLATMRS